MGDEELMQAYARGDASAFEELFRRHAGLVLGTLRRGYLDHATCEDLAQQVFLQVHRARHDYDPRRPFRPWLLTIARNVKRDHLRSLLRRPPPRSLVEPDPAAPPGGDVRRREAQEVLERALARLPLTLRSVVEMHWLHEQPFPEVARRLGLTTSAAKVRAHRAYRALREVLEEPPPEGGM